MVVLGSAPLLIARGLTESLAGRFETLRLPHWSYAEMREAFDFTQPDLYFAWVSRRSTADPDPARSGNRRQFRSGNRPLLCPVGWRTGPGVIAPPGEKLRMPATRRRSHTTSICWPECLGPCRSTRATGRCRRAAGARHRTMTVMPPSPRQRVPCRRQYIEPAVGAHLANAETAGFASCRRAARSCSRLRDQGRLPRPRLKEEGESRRLPVRLSRGADVRRTLLVGGAASRCAHSTGVLLAGDRPSGLLRQTASRCSSRAPIDQEIDCRRPAMTPRRCCPAVTATSSGAPRCASCAGRMPLMVSSSC